ncbi:molybdopterin-dependent oxidoreductase [Desulfofundulus thermocisternus]|uniref:molybdopterin-dependent oxidoreductase n=1 Tax=Desulfofundulus thermocisternus TaxID=42471 RepID=UPI0019ED4B2C|nr:molybdopterin-dependent oxidoreductase [Desulfofundulus thermocisternus]MBE3586151.1 molybdopterin-dependent oxidoreductase [Thermoanaerobacter sp.]MCS5694907.1 molybdopterin-dependent oxidoreductase [Desulfofundulus thermocisternus]
MESVYSICFMCTVRCPIKVMVENDDVKLIEGNPHVAGIEGSICPKGAAGVRLLNDDERLKRPLIRTGPRGSGQWREASWEEALDYVAAKLAEVKEKYGGRAIALAERAQLNSHISKTFLKALGSPNYFTHDSCCKGSLNTAFRTLTGYTDGQVGVDWGKTKHIVLYGRNIFESLELKAVKQLMQALEKGTRLTYIDPRVTVTATKAHKYLMIRPGTDLALNYALMHVILKEGLYDKEFVNRWVLGLKELQQFVEPYTPEWAEKETGIPAYEIVSLAREVSEAKPSVIFHYGYRCSHYLNEIYFRRSIIMLNALMGSIEAPGGIFFKKGAKDAGRKPLNKLTDQELPKVTEERCDGVGTPRLPLPDPAHGVVQMLPKAILEEDPYPVKALLVWRFNPLLSIPDYEYTRRALENLDLLVTIDIQFSEIAWYSDVVLPESTYLERGDSIQEANGLKPALYMRRPAVSPRYDTKPGWEIMKSLADRLGIGQYFPYHTLEELWAYQLQGTGISISDFDEKGYVSLSDEPIYWDRKDGIKLKTPSGKIEFMSSLLEKNGFPSFPAYEPVPAPPEGYFRLMIGRAAAHTHVSTQNNPLLNELVPENVLWINTRQAAKLGIKNGQMVEVISSRGRDTIRAFVTDLIHPEAVFMLHGFGHKVPVQSRCYGKGAMDALLQENITDMVGGSPALQGVYVTVRPIK